MLTLSYLKDPRSIFCFDCYFDETFYNHLDLPGFGFPRCLAWNFKLFHFVRSCFWFAFNNPPDNLWYSRERSAQILFLAEGPPLGSSARYFRTKQINKSLSNASFFDFDVSSSDLSSSPSFSPAAPAFKTISYQFLLYITKLHFFIAYIAHPRF